HPQPERQEGINSGRLLADHSSPQHEPMGRDLRFFRSFAQDRQEVSGKAHEISWCFGWIRPAGRGSEAAMAAELQGPVSPPPCRQAGTLKWYFFPPGRL